MIQVYLNDYFKKLIQKSYDSGNIKELESIRTVIHITPLCLFEKSMEDTRYFYSVIHNHIETIKNDEGIE